jgi:hypothetical protein
MPDKRGATHKQAPIRIAGLLAVCCIAWLALGAGGCSRDPDQATVDFSKTLPVARPTPSAGEAIARTIQAFLKQGCDLLLLSGGMSVDPDDVTRHAIRRAGATEVHYGSAVLPGAMFLVAYLGEVPLLGVPACALHHPGTVLDLVLPRILAGEHMGKKELALLGHGGLCRDCSPCIYPHCPFGKGM